MVRKALALLFIIIIVAPSCLAYQNVTQQQTKELLGQDIVVIDCRPCKCNYDKGHIEGSIWSVNPTYFYSESRDIMVYGEGSDEFCMDLSNNTDVNVYNLHDYMGLFDYSRSNISTTDSMIFFGLLSASVVAFFIVFYWQIKKKGND